MRDPRRTIPRAIAVALSITVVVYALVAVLAGPGLLAAIGFPSFGVLAYYAIANASAWTLGRDEGRLPPWIPVVGLIGRVAVAVSLPLSSIASGAGVLAAGAIAYLVTRHGADR